MRQARGILDRGLRALCSLVLFAAAVAPAVAADPGDGQRWLRLRAGDTDPRTLAPERLASNPGGVLLVQATGDPDALRRAFVAAGARVLSYVPDGAWLVRMPTTPTFALASLPGVRWAGAPRPEWKISPDLGLRAYDDAGFRAGGSVTLDVDLYPGEDGGAVERELAVIAEQVLDRQSVGPRERIRLRARPAQVQRIAAHPGVDWVQESGEITLRNNTTHWVIQTDVPASTTVWDHGIHGEGQIVGHIDGPIDMSSCYVRDASVGSPGPTHRKIVAYRSAAGLGADGHGTHTAGTVAGDRTPINGSTDQNGNAWAARLSHTNVNDIFGSGSAPSNLYSMLLAAHGDGARVHTNSWGDDGTTQYTSWCRDIDEFSWENEDSLVLFSVTNTSTLKTPENAKNCLAVGGSFNGASASQFCTGGTGPTSDGRRKPEVYAPGCSIVSASAGQSCGTTSSSGTSMACPAVTAAGALVRQYFTEGWYPTGLKTVSDSLTPTGALTKAMLVSSAVDMTGVAGYPSLREGWGRILLENSLYFLGDTKGLVVRDVRNAAGLGTGQLGDLAVDVSGSADPLRVTLAWTDPPASLLAAQAWVNDLDLEVRAPDGTTYFGNVLASGFSVPGGVRDDKNNVEQVIVSAPAPGTWTVTVRGRAVPQGPQGYALVASGAVGARASPIVTVAEVVRQDSCRTSSVLLADGSLQPGEASTLNVRLRNVGEVAATNVHATLTTSSAHVTVLHGASDYPDIPPGATVDPLPGGESTFVISESAACGASLGLVETIATATETRASPLTLAVQESPQVPIWSDDFESDRGWVVSSPNTATSGNFQRGDPEGSIAQPADDHTATPGATCWATGLALSGAADANDVDGGTTTLLSPSFDLLASVDPWVEYWRWYSNDRGAAPTEDELAVQISFNNGVSWKDLERTTVSDAAWRKRAFRIRDVGVPSMRVRVRVVVWDFLSDSLVEAAFDDFAVTDLTACGICYDESTPPGEASPVVAAPLRVSKAVGGGFDLSWSEPIEGGRPASYALYRTPLGSYTPACEVPLPFDTATHVSSLADGGFLIVARNTGGEGSYGPGRAAAIVPCP